MNAAKWFVIVFAGLFIGIVIGAFVWLLAGMPT